MRTLPLRLRSAGEREYGYLFLRHTLAVNDVLIGMETLSRQVPQITIQTILHERTLRRMPVAVTTAAGERARVIPDGWVDLRIALPGGVDRQCIALGVDRGTTEQRAFRRRIRHLIAFAAGPYQGTYRTTILTIAVIATPGEGRAAELIRWTAAELTLCGAQTQADLYRFAALPDDPSDLPALFLAPRWQRPGSEIRLPLIDGFARDDPASTAATL